MEIRWWQETWSQFINKRYPKRLNIEQRLLAIIRQVADASMELAKKQDSIDTHHVSHVDHRQAIAAIFIDLFVLAEDQGVDLEVEFKKSFEWFAKHPPPEG